MSLEAEGGREAALSEGQSATLLCTVDAKPLEELRYAWKRDGSLLQHEHGRRLRIAALQPFHHGAVFECEAGNEVGLGRGSFTAALAFAPRMPTDDRVAVDVGDTVTLSCPADGNPLPVIAWTKDGAPDNVLGMGVK